MSIRLVDLLAPRKPGGPLYLALDHLRSLVQAEIVVARVAEVGREITVFGRYRKSRIQLGDSTGRALTLVIEVSRQELDDLLKVVEAVKGDDAYPLEPQEANESTSSITLSIAAHQKCLA